MSPPTDHGDETTHTHDIPGETTVDEPTSPDRNEDGSEASHPPPTRTYTRVRPTTDPLNPDTVIAHLRHLYHLDGPPKSPRLFRATPEPITIEILLRSGPDIEGVEYLLGVDEEHAASFQRVLRGLFPDSYEFTQRESADGWPLPDSGPEPHPMAITYQRRTAHKHDWQTQLTPFETFLGDEHARVPLATVIEVMAEYDQPILFQCLLQPKPDWTAVAEERRLDIERCRDTWGDRLYSTVFEPPEAPDLSTADEQRLGELAARETRCSFTVSARTLVWDAESDSDTDTIERDGQRPSAIRALVSAFTDLGKTGYEIEARVLRDGAAGSVVDAVRDRRPVRRSRRRLPAVRFPGTPHRHPEIVADVAEVASFFLVGGNALTTAGARALSPTPGERTAIPRPPAAQLATYTGAGMAIGQALTQDDTPEPTELVIPPRLQPMHVAWVGKTGSGKSTGLINAILSNHRATQGADILIDPKGDGMAREYLRAHYAEYGTLDNVRYFDCASVLPAFSFFDIRDELAAGVSRTTAVEDTVDHYIEILTQIMGRERFDQAVRSPDIIRYVTKAAFDPVNGSDAFTHRDLHSMVRRMHERQSAPAVSDPDLERMLAGIVANRARTFDEIMQGVANRMEKIPVDQRLARIFNHVPESLPDGDRDRLSEADSDSKSDSESDLGRQAGDSASNPDSDLDGESPSAHTSAADAAEDPHFDLADSLDEDVVIVFDTGGLRTEAQRVLTLVILSNLWTALRRRRQRSQDDGHRRRAGETNGQGEDDGPAQGGDERGGPAHDPLVNLYIEEAASVAASDLLKKLLAQSRSFDCSVTLAMQFPAQLRESDERVYQELLNNISTFVTGNVGVDRLLAERMATDEMPARDVGSRLRALRRGQWLVRLPADFDRPEPRPFLAGSLPLPPGDPAGDRPLSPADARAFTTAFTEVRDTTLARAGLTLASPSVIDREEESPPPDPDALPRVDTALPYTTRLPSTVEYDAGIHALRCRRCDNRYDAGIAGMKRAIACCESLGEIHTDDIPICELNLKLSPEERVISPYSDAQLRFLQAVYNAQQLRYDPLEYNLLYDSMIRLQEYVDVSTEEIDDLLDADVLRHDTDHPHRLYTVTPEGRAVIGESYRQGVDYGHGQGDLEESTQHVFAVEVARRYLVREYVEDPDSRVVEVVPYYDLDANHRLDLAGLDDDGAFVVTVEVERINHDVGRAAPEDFDKMAGCAPEEAIWIVMTQSDGHRLLQALQAPLDGKPRVEKTYASTTPPQQFRIDTPGLTAVYPVEWVRETFLTESTTPP